MTVRTKFCCQTIHQVQLGPNRPGRTDFTISNLLNNLFSGPAFICRLYNITHFNQDMEKDWGAYVTEKPTDPKDVPTVTPAGFPIEPMVLLCGDRARDEQRPRPAALLTTDSKL